MEEKEKMTVLLKDRRKKNMIFGAVMAVMLLLQLGTLLYYGNRKAGYHEDELYTYYSTNKTAGLFVNDRQWLEREQLFNDFVVLRGEQFRYDVVKQMQSWDVHPPLYYYIFHTVCSLFPGVFSKWLGIGVNLIGYVLSFILLAYCVYTAQTQKDEEENRERGRLLSGLICLGWGFGAAVISGVMFIRMYQWLTLFVLLCLALHLRALKKDQFSFVQFYLPLGITVFLGFLTQYYYIIFHFFLGLGFCFLLLREKKLKRLLAYGAACGGGLLAAVLYYPACLSHIFRGYRGTEAVSEFGDASNTMGRLRFFTGLFDDYMLNGSLSIWLLALCLLALTLWYLKKRKGEKLHLPGRAAGLMLFTVAGYFFTVSKTALLLGETSNRYQLPVYGIALFLLMGALWSLCEEGISRLWHSGKGSGIRRGLTLLFGAALLIIDVTALCRDRVFFLYEEERENMEFVQAHRETPVVVFYHESSGDHIWWLSDELMEYPRVYLASQGNREPITEEEITGSESLVVYVADHEDQEASLERLMENNKNLDTCTAVLQKGLWTVYLLD